MIKSLFRICLSLFFTTACFFAQAQGSAVNNNITNWSSAWKPQKVFIENKGQFPEINHAVVKYVYDGDGTNIYFSANGLAYTFFEKIVDKEDEEEREREERESHKKIKNLEDWIQKEKEEHKVKYKSDVVYLTWQNANPNPEIIASEKVDNYFSYSFRESNEDKNINYINGYKKITYKNLYPNIDVEYTFHPTDGIKYALILHPGADITQVKMSYADTKKINLKSNGDIYIKTVFGNIIDHAPVSFYQNNTANIINSHFIKEEKTVSFQLDKYDNTKTVVIDPWTQTPSLSNSNGVWECEKDGGGNVYIIGGDVPMKLLKYNAAGALQWTFTTAYDTSQNDWLGTFATDLAGNSYVTCGSTASLTKVNSAGTQVYKVSGGSNDEYWNIAFNCDQTKLIIAGTRLTGLPSITGSGVIFDINTSNGSVNGIKTVGGTTAGGFGINNPDEVRSITSSRNAKYYYLTLDSLGCIDQNFSACPTATSLFKTGGLALSYKCENYRPKNGNSGIMALRANANFVYTHNGTTIQKRSLGSGAVLASATIPGGTSSTSLGLNQVGNSGIDIDSCGNVYVGSGNSVIKYDANLNQLSSAATTFKVYDVTVSYGGNVIAAGATGNNANTSRTGYVQSFAMGACNPIVLQCCDATICPAGPFCTTDPSFTLTPVTPGGTWSGAGVNASGVFNPATAGAGTHTIIYTLACGKDSIQIKVNSCASLTVCVNGSNLNVSGGTPSYTWSVYGGGGSTPITTQAQCTACNSGYTWLFGQCLNGATPVTTCSTAASWQQVGTGTSIATPTTTPIKVTDNAGNSYTVTTIATLPNCTSCTSPTVTVSSTTSVSCYGGNTGAATVSATPAGTYTYTWQPGNLTGVTQSGLAAGVYTISASNGTCTGTVTVNITQPTALTASITATSPASCGANNGVVTVSANGGTAGYTYTWSPSGGNTATASNLAGGSYTVTIKDANSCTVATTASVTTTSTPTLSVNSTTVCAGTPSTLTVSGATTYSWTPSTGLSSTNSTTVTATPTTTTIYTVTGTAGTCSSTATSTVTVNPIPTATATGTAIVCTGQTISLGVTTNASTYAWSGPNTFTSNIQNPSITNATNANAGVYTVTVTANGCTAVSSLTVNVTNSTSVTVTPAGPYCSGGSAVTLTASVAGGTWSGTGITNVNTGAFDPQVAGAGTYTISYVISGSCGSSDSTVITVNPGPTATASVNASLVCAGQSISLSVNTTGGATYAWAGPSSYAANTQNPTITNATTANSGIYTVTVSSANCTAVDTVSVKVVSNPTITVNSASICAGNSATLTANGATSYTWSPATGLSTSTGSIVVANPNNTTTYTLTGSVGTCAAVPATSTVTVNPTPTITVNNASLCSSTTITITVSGANTYSWTPATGLSSTTGSMVTTNPGAATTYTVIGTDVNGCQNTATLTVVNSPSITTTMSSTSVTCNGLSNGTASVTAGGSSGSGYTYAWAPSGGTNASTTNIPAGTYTCTITDGAGCTATATVAVTQPQQLSVTATSAVICYGQSYTLSAVASGGTSPYTYNWNGGAATTNTFVVTPTSATGYTVTATDANGCQPAVDNSVIIGVKPPLQVTVGDAAICAGNTATLTATASGGNGSYTYSWTPTGQFGSTITDTPLSTTIYTVMVSDGCTTVSATDTGIVNVTPAPVIPPPAPASGCAPICINFTNPPGVVNWQWNFGDGSSSTLSNPIHCYTTAGSFNISLAYTTNIGCASTVTYSNVVNIYPVPKALYTASPNPTDIFNPQVYFNNQSINSSTWHWTFGDGNSSTDQSPTHTYGQTGLYPIMLIAQSVNGCRDTIRGQVTINDIYTFYAPNAFTPDNVVNTKFLPIGEGWDNTSYHLWIFDRWGVLIYKTQDVNKGWDGKVNPSADVVQEDVYVWKVQLNDIFGKSHQYTGTVTLIK